MSDHQEQPRLLRPLHRLCPTCNGDGSVVAPRTVSFADGTGGTAHVVQQCPTCGGDGWLDVGLVPVV